MEGFLLDLTVRVEIDEPILAVVEVAELAREFSQPSRVVRALPKPLGHADRELRVSQDAFNGTEH